jgi:hypothetical protein
LQAIAIEDAKPFISASANLSGEQFVFFGLR